MHAAPAAPSVHPRHGGSQGRPGDQAALAGRVEPDAVDAVRVVVVQEQVAGQLLYLGCSDLVGAGGGLAVDEQTAGDEVGIRALSAFWRVVDLMRQRGMRGLEATVLRELSRALLALGRTDQAIAALARAVTCLGEEGDHEGEGEALFGLGKALVEVGRCGQAAVVALRCAEVSRGAHRPDLEQGALVEIGVDIANAGRAEEALPVFRRLHEACAAAGDREKEGWALVLVAGALVDAGRFAQAVPANHQAVDFCRATGNTLGTDTALSQLGKAELGLRLRAERGGTP